ncbi:Glycosyltransferase involved in cell wall bisynthesis [Oscillospiraceae bacterium]|nr:Glycosyltransferase involved in cell wall bisynthesis [Oscillospiraceae bacterium]
MPDKKKLLITASTFPRWEGDTEPRFILDLAKNMTDEFDVTVLAPAAIGAKEKEDLEGVHVIRYHYFPIRKLETLCYPGAIVPRIKEKKARGLLVPFLMLSLKLKLNKIHKDYDIIHAHWLIPQGIAQSSYKTPYIVTGHGSDIASLNFQPMKSLKRKCLDRAAQVTVVSNYLKGKAEEITERRDIKVIPMGCDTTKFSPEFRQERYFGDDKKTVLFVGRLVTIKGVEYLIEAMKGVDARLVIVGEGPIKDDLKKNAEEAGIDAVFMGGKSHEELKVIYASSDVFVSPSITLPNGAQEGLGLVALEAMSSGVPVIGSRSGGIVEVIDDGNNGILFDEKNVNQLRKSIKAILSNESLSRKLRHQALIDVKRYDYKETAKRYKECYKEILH